jgi:amino acid transporter
MAATATPGTGPGLRRNAIGLREVLFQSITDMAPGAAIAASIPAGVAFAGGSLPLAVVFALIACLFCASSIGLLAREMPSAGSLATYAARGLHPSVGFLVACGYVLVGFLIPPLVLLQLGFTTAATLNSEFQLVIVLVAIYILMNAACIGFFARRGHGFNPFLHLLVPLLGIAVFVPAWLTAAGIKVFSFVAKLSPPYSYMGPGVAGWLAVGVIYLVYLYIRAPGRVTEVGLVPLDLEPDTEPAFARTSEE